MCSITKEELKSLHRGKFIWLTYIPRVLLTEFNMVSDVEARIHINCPGLTVDKCGIRLLYRHEDDGFNKVITDCWTSFFDNLSLKRQLVEAHQNVGPCQQWTRRELPLLEGHIMDFDRDLIYNATFPSKETPEWFGHGLYVWASLTVQLPPSCGDKSWIGLALCVLYLEPSDFKGNKSYYCSCRLETGINGLSSLHHYQMTNEEYSKCIEPSLNCITYDPRGGFIWLSYIPRRWFLHQLNDESVIAALFDDKKSWAWRRVSHRFVYEHDLEEFNQLCVDLRRPGA